MKGLTGIAALDIAAAENFPEWLARLYREKYTGQVVLHFAQGHPKAVEVKTSTVIPLDSRKS